MDDKATINEIANLLIKSHPEFFNQNNFLLPETEQTRIEFFANFTSNFGGAMQQAFSESLALRSFLPKWIVTMRGMSGRNV